MTTEALAACHVCGNDRLSEANSKIVSLRSLGYVRICNSRACGFAIDQVRSFPVYRPDMAVR